MHSHDRTLLARLGFEDPDKKEPLHDMACQYLSQPEIVVQIAKSVIPDGSVFERFSFNPDHYNQYRFVNQEQRTTGITFNFADNERVISKGEGQYKTHIGFLDVLASVYLETNDHFSGFESISSNGKRAKGEPFLPYVEKGPREKQAFAFEVKVLRVSAAEIVRQINLYREYCKKAHWFAVTTFPMSPEAVGVLKNSGIRHLKLGPKFDDYVSSRNASGENWHQSPEI